MKRKLRGWLGSGWLWMALLFACPLWLPNVHAQQALVFKAGVQQGALKVKFKPNQEAVLSKMRVARSSAGVVTTGVKGLDMLAQRYKATQFKRLFPYNPKDEAKLRKHGLHLWYEVSVDNSVDVMQATAAYKQLAELQTAEPHLQKTYENASISEVKKSARAKATSETLPMNDPMLKDQWHYHNNGSLKPSIAGADINLFKAWEVSTGMSNVIVSVHDEGVDAKHEDLAANMWVNVKERDGKAGVDDDGNGYVDDVYGYNFASSKGTVDPQPHGTHVAGTVAAVNNNGKGVSGVAGGSGNGDGARIMSCQILGGNNNIADSYRYAALNGAVISQNSWGYTQMGGYEQSVLDAIDYFIAEAGDYPGSPMKGGIVIFAAGNSNANGPHYPGYYENTLAVASTGPNYQRAAYSNYGEWVELAAPGGDQNYSSRHGVLSTLPGNKYGYFQGTSMACPHVSGIAALVVSKYGGAEFTAAQLRQQLLTACRDIDTYNPGYEGLLGRGQIDTWLAMKRNEGKAPVAVADLAVKAVAQDFAQLGWSVPTDEDDDRPVSFRLVYSTDTLLENNWQKAPYKDIINKATAGSAVSYELKNLKSLTKYYVGIVGIDRWGNRSVLSKVVSFTTNQGPIVELSLTKFTFDINAAVQAMKEVKFMLKNAGEGTLRWGSEVRQTLVSFATNAVEYPTAPARKDSYKVGREISIEKVYEGKEAVAPSLKYPTKSISYSPYLYYLIGEEDISVPNSLATRYTVKDKEGFNLTHLKQSLRSDPATGKVIAEVRRGEVLEKSEVVAAVSYAPNGNYSYVHTVTLPEQLFFAQGETFWVVFHVPANNRYPLGMGALEDPTLPKSYSKMSLDVGNTWVDLADMIGSDDFAWTGAVESRSPHMGTIATLTPDGGEMTGKTAQELNLEVDATNLLNGTYRANLLFKSNDSNKPEVRLPIDLKVSGHAPVLSSVAVADFGSVFMGKNKELSIAVKNNGLGNFTFATTGGVVSSNPDFKVVSTHRVLLAIDQEILRVLYTPSSEGPSNGEITLTDKSGRIFTFSAFGMGTAPAEMDIAPEMQEVSLNMGDKSKGSITIQNTGKYPLQYYMPKYTAAPEGLPKASNKFGYSATKVAYEWNSIADKGVDMTKQLNVQTDEYVGIDLGFDLPFFGQHVKKLYATAYGALTPDNSVINFLNMFPADLGWAPLSDGMITAACIPLIFGDNGRAYYLRENGKVTIEYNNVTDGLNYRPLTFQIQIFANGNVRYVYKDMGVPINVFNSYALVGLEAIDQKDGIKVSQKQQASLLTSGNKEAIEFRHPGPEMVKNLSKTSGLLPVGKSETISFDILAAGVTQGTHSQYVEITSNDLMSPSKAFEVKVNVLNGGVADVQASADTLNFLQVPVSGEVKETLAFFNKGTKDSEMVKMEGDYADFDINLSLPAPLKVRQGLFMDVKLKSGTVGKKKGHLVFTDAEGKTYKVTLLAEVIPAPALKVDGTAMAFKLNTGEQEKRSITLDNSAGEGVLEVVPVGNDWLQIAPAVAPNQLNGAFPTLPEFTYHKRDNVSGKAIYAWDDITETGTRIPYDMQKEEYVKEVELPFEFPFYGKTYKKAFVSMGGIVSFSDPIDMELFPPKIPTQGDAFKNYIAAFWGPIAPYQYAPEATKGVFMQTYEDRVVISYNEMSSLFAFHGGAASSQMILYKNGEIKFQYKVTDNDAYSWIWRQAVGVENEDGTEGVQVSHAMEYLRDGMAIELSPARKFRVQPGEKKQLDVIASAQGLNEGSYETELLLQHNSPGLKTVQIPVSLKVTGSVKVVLPDTLKMGEIMAYQTPTGPKSYENIFYVENKGTAAIMVETLKMQNGKQAQLQHLVPRAWDDPQWKIIDPRYPVNAKVEAGKRKAFKLLLMPTQEGALNDTILMGTDKGAYQIAVTANVVLPPVVEIAEEELNAIARNAQHTETKSFWIDNTQGKSVLKYGIEMEYLYAGAAQATASEYNQVLEYTQDSVPNNFLGFGGSQDFTIATAFTAPEKGFKLSHVQLHHRIIETDSAEILVRIMTEDGKVLSQQTVISRKKDNASDLKGQAKVIALPQTVDIMPGQKFYMATTFPMTEGYPAALKRMAAPLAKTFFVELEGEFIDLAETQFSAFGWMMKAMEKNALESVWATVVGETSGSIPAGERKEVSVKFQAKENLPADLHANLYVHTNDPTQTNGHAIALHMHMNQAPAFAEMPERVETKENETAVWKWAAKDIEGDTITYMADKLPAFAKLEVSGDTAIVTAKPSFEQAGTYSFSLKAADKYGAATARTLTLAVMDVNRAPVAKQMEAINCWTGQKFLPFKTSELVSDQDKDQLSFQVSSTSPGMAAAVLVGEELRILPMALGSTDILLTATDTKGASTTLTIRVNVVDPVVLGIEQLAEGSVKLFPNPATGQQPALLAYQLSKPAQVRIELRSVQGQLLSTQEAQQGPEAQQVQIDVKTLPAGVYIVSLFVDGKPAKTLRLVKQ